MVSSAVSLLREFARFAARHLVHLLDSAPLELAEAELSERLGGEWTPGLGLTPLCHDPSAGVREAALGLAMFAERGGQR